MNRRGVREQLEREARGHGLVVAGAHVAGGGQRSLLGGETLRGFPQHAVAPRRRPLGLVVEPRLALHLERGHVRLGGVPFLEAHERVAGQAGAGQLVVLENFGAARRPALDLREHRVKALLGGLALDLGARFETPFAPVVQVPHPDQVVERLGALELLVPAPADIREIVVLR